MNIDSITIDGMNGRKKKKQDEEEKQPTPRKGKPLHVWIDADLRDALEALKDKTRRLLTTEVSIAIENHLKANGLWPPPTSP